MGGGDRQGRGVLELWNYRGDSDPYLVNGSGRNPESTLCKRLNLTES